MTITDRIIDEARKLSISIGESPSSQATVLELSSALLAAEQRGREMERERATKIMLGVSDVLKRHLIDKATPELLDALADAMNAASDEMEAAAIRSRTTEG